MILKLGTQHRGLQLYIVSINDDPGLTLTYFTARSNFVAYTFELGNLLQSSLMGKLQANGQIDGRFMFLKNNLTPWGCLSLPLGLYTRI